MSDAPTPPPTNTKMKRLRERIATWSDISAPEELVEKAKKALKSRKSKRDATSRNKAYRAIADQLPDNDPVTWFQLSVGVMGEAGCWATSRGCEVRELLDWCDECLLLMGEGEELTSDRGRQWRAIKLGATFERDLAVIIEQILSGDQTAAEADAAPTDASVEPTAVAEEVGVEDGPDEVPTPVDSGSPDDVPTPDPAPASSGALESPAGGAPNPAPAAPAAEPADTDTATPEPDPAPEPPAEDAAVEPSPDSDDHGERQAP